MQLRIIHTVDDVALNAMVIAHTIWQNSSSPTVSWFYAVLARHIAYLGNKKAMVAPSRLGLASRPLIVSYIASHVECFIALLCCAVLLLCVVLFPCSRCSLTQSGPQDEGVGRSFDEKTRRVQTFGAGKL